MKILITMHEPSNMLNVPYMAIRQLVKNEEVAVSRVGRIYYINTRSLLERLNLTEDDLKEGNAITENDIEE